MRMTSSPSPRQYSAQFELNEFIENIILIRRNWNPWSYKGTWILKRGMTRTQVERNYMKNKTGNNVLFGDTIQLYHMK